MKLRMLLPAVLATVAAVSCGRGVPSPVDSVDTHIGGVGVLLQPTRPTVQLPNQLVRWSPLRADLLDDQVADYPLTLTTHRLQSVFGFLPLPVGSEEGAWWSYRQVYDNEKTTPYSYTSLLEGCNIRFSAAARSGIAEVNFDGDKGGLLRFNIINGPDGKWTLGEDGILRGEESFAGIKAYTCVLFDSPVEKAAETPACRNILLKTAAKTVRVRYAISYIDCDQALANLEKEIPAWDIDKVCADARSAWKGALGQI